MRVQRSYNREVHLLGAALRPHGIALDHRRSCQPGAYEVFVQRRDAAPVLIFSKLQRGDFPDHSSLLGAILAAYDLDSAVSTGVMSETESQSGRQCQQQCVVC